jgi:hypothetical protein
VSENNQNNQRTTKTPFSFLTPPKKTSCPVHRRLLRDWCEARKFARFDFTAVVSPPLVLEIAHCPHIKPGHKIEIAKLDSEHLEKVGHYHAERFALDNAELIIALVPLSLDPQIDKNHLFSFVLCPSPLSVDDLDNVRTVGDVEFFDVVHWLISFDEHF